MTDLIDQVGGRPDPRLTESVERMMREIIGETQRHDPDLHENEQGIKWFFGKPYFWVRDGGKRGTLRLVQYVGDDTPEEVPA